MNEDAWIMVSAVILRIWGSIDEQRRGVRSCWCNLFDCQEAVIDHDPQIIDFNFNVLVLPKIHLLDHFKYHIHLKSSHAKMWRCKRQAT